MTPAAIDRLQAAADFVAERISAGDHLAAIIEKLVADHAARFDRSGYAEHRLRVAGVASSCTRSSDHGLLANWRKTATLRLMRERGACSSDRGRVG